MTDIADDYEWTVEGFLADCEQIRTNPPLTPDGFDLIECDATPRHWPLYEPYVDGGYPATCLICERDAIGHANDRLRCERDHRRWKSWHIWWLIASRLYVLGITSSGGGVSMGRCEFCGITRQHMAPNWRGKRSYILGVRRETWTCLRRGHRHSPTHYGLCSVCAPCPSCESTDPSHPGDCS
jgi:hypothetical protein